MDASLYHYLIEELQNVPDKSYAQLPALFVKSAPTASNEGFDACK
jgi:hypothetical protein